MKKDTTKAGRSGKGPFSNKRQNKAPLIPSNEFDPTNIKSRFASEIYPLLFIPDTPVLITHPYKRYGDWENPFHPNDPFRAYVMMLLVDGLVSYISDCADDDTWIAKRDITKADRRKILKERDKFISLLNLLLPKAARKQASHLFLRVCELMPNYLISLVDFITVRLKSLQYKVKTERKFLEKDSHIVKREVIERYINQELYNFYNEIKDYHTEMNLPDVLIPFEKVKRHISLRCPRTEKCLQDVT